MNKCSHSFICTLNLTFWLALAIDLLISSNLKRFQKLLLGFIYPDIPGGKNFIVFVKSTIFLHLHTTRCWNPFMKSKHTFYRHSLLLTDEENLFVPWFVVKIIVPIVSYFKNGAALWKNVCSLYMLSDFIKWLSFFAQVGTFFTGKVTFTSSVC